MTYSLIVAGFPDVPVFLDLYGWAYAKQYCFGFDRSFEQLEQHISNGLHGVSFVVLRDGATYKNDFFVWVEVHDGSDNTTEKIGVADGVIFPAINERNSYCIVNQMVIEPRRQNEGHGRNFLNALIDIYFSQGIDLVFKLNAKQKAAAFLLQKVGFRKVDQSDSKKRFVEDLWALKAPHGK